MESQQPSYFQENESFFMLGEVYHYTPTTGLQFDFGDKKVNYFDFGFDALINFSFDANRAYEAHSEV